MFKRPIFKTSFHVEIILPNKVFLFDEKRNCYFLEGASYAYLAPYLYRKRYSVDEIVKALHGKLPEREIYRILQYLEEKGVLEEAENGLLEPLLAFCHFLNVPIETVKYRLKETPISIVSLGGVETKPLESLLEKLSLNIEVDGAFTAVLSDSYRHKDLKDLNAKFLNRMKPWMLVKPVGAEIWIGPLFVPKKTGCFECLYEFLKYNAIEEVIVEKEKRYSRPLQIDPLTLSTTAAISFGLVANEILKWVLQGFNSQFEGKILSYHSTTCAFEFHHLIKRPQCPACGEPALRQKIPLVLERQTKGFVEDGGHRIISPETTYETYQHFISPITGIVNYLRPAQQNKLPHIAVYEAQHNFANPDFQGIGFLIRGARRTSAGKGKSEQQAKTSCLCEAIERYSGAFHGDEIRKKSSYAQLKNDAIHPSSCLLFSENQYRNRNSRNRNSNSFHYIPSPFDEEKRVEWTPIWSLTESRFKWIPTPLCYFSYPFRNEKEKFWAAGSSGCASGNTKEEAILHGFFELVERDHAAIWWYSRLQRPGVDLESFEDPYIVQLISYYASCGREVWALDLTMDFQIPVFISLSRSINSEKEQILFGFGSHFDPKIALLRALTEMNQTFGYIFKEGKVIERSLQGWLNSATIKDQSYLCPDLSKPHKNYRDYTRLDRSDLKEDILTCQKIIAEKTMEMFVLDQTRPEVGLPVVKVFVPGLRPYWNRYGKGRLYDVPIQLGLLEKKMQEKDLNPFPIFF